MNACKCIEDFNKMLREKTGDPEASVDIAMSINFGVTESAVTPAMYCTYRKTLKKGGFGKPSQHPISGDYCPFCGKKRDE